MAEKNIKSRIVNKHDVEANWNKASSFKPLLGEIIVYDIDSNYNYERIKIGDGKTSVVNLPFIAASEADSAGATYGLSTSGDGTAYNAIVPGIDALESGVSFIMIPNVTSTSTAPTLNVNGFGAKPIKRRLSSIGTGTQSGYTASWLAKNVPFRVVYDGTSWIVEGLTKPAAADLYGAVQIAKGGTGATDAETALANLGAASTEELERLVGDTPVPDQINSAIATKADTNHTHDDRYYTETEVDNKLKTKSDTDHTHDYAASTHSHAISDVTNLQTNLNAKVPTSRTINGKSLSANITLSATDVGADTSGSASSALTNAKAYTDSEITEWVGDKTVATQISTAIASKSDVDHTHTASQVGADPSGSASSALSSAKSYTDTAISNLINSAPTTLDTLGEIATAMQENEDVVKALDEAVGSKANASDLTSHTGNKSNPHGVSLSQLGVTATATELNYVDGVTSNVQTQINNINSLIGDESVAKQINDAIGDVTLASLGVTATAAELNYVDGVTSNVQTQLNGKAASSHTHKYAGSSSTGGAATKAIADQNGSQIDRVYCSMIPFGTEVTASKNLNTTEFLSVGNYYCAKHDTAATLTNCPVKVAFMMQVYSPLSTTIDNEATKTWCYRLRKLTTYDGIEYVQKVNSQGTAGTFVYDTWNKTIKSGDVATTTAAGIVTVDSALSASSTNPVQNKAVNTAITNLSTLVGDTAVSTQIESAIASHTHSNYVNQNAFSNIKVGSTTVAADAVADTLTLVAGSNVTLTPDSANDKITIAATDTVYTHPTTTGNKHIPSGGSSGQILRWAADGTAAWGADNNTTYNVATTSANGLMSSADKTTLNNLSSLVGDTAVSTQISNALSGYAKTANYSATLSSSGWSGSSAPYSQTVTVSGILAPDTPIIDVNMSSATTAATGVALLEAWACVGRISTAANKITAYCYEEKPTTNIPIQIKVVR